MENLKNKKLIYVLLVLLIAAQAGYLIYTFTCRKQGYHSDEIWTYGLANSYYQPFLIVEDGVFVDDINNDVLIGLNRWEPGSQLRDYITVQPGERFAYGSVWHNQSLDRHPPLFYALLHTVCSFFPNRFSWWYGFSLCLFCFVGTQIFLFLAAREMTRSEFAAFLTCLLYGCGTGMLCTFAFVRQYSLLTMLCAAFVFFSFRLQREEAEGGKFHKKTLAGVVVSAFLAFMTHYYAIAFIGTYTALYCLVLLFKRRIRQMLSYGGGIFCALLSSFVIYPAALFHIFHFQAPDMKSQPFLTQIRMLLSQMFQYNFGFRVPYQGAAIWNIALLVLAVLICAGVLFGAVRDEKRYPGCEAVFVLAASFSIYATVAKLSDVALAGIFVMRYIALTFPLICMLAVSAASRILECIRALGKWKHVILAAAVFATVLCVRTTSRYPYRFADYGDSRDVQEITSGKRVLVIHSMSATRLINSACFLLYLSDTEEYFFTAANRIRDCFDRVTEPDEAIDYVIIERKCIDLTPGEGEKVRGWRGMTKEQEEAEKLGSGYPPEVLEEMRRQRNCTDLVEELCGDGSYEVIKMFGTQNGGYYILELHE